MVTAFFLVSMMSWLLASINHPPLIEREQMFPSPLFITLLSLLDNAHEINEISPRLGSGIANTNCSMANVSDELTILLDFVFLVVRSSSAADVNLLYM